MNREESLKMSFFRQLKNSVTDFDSYKYFVSQSVGKAFLYLFLLSILFSAISGFRLIYEFNAGINEILQGIHEEVPNFKLENGELMVDADMPLVVDQDEEGIFIIDTTGKSDENILNNYPNGILITKDKAFMKENEFQTRNIDFRSLEGLSITKDDLENWLPYLKLLVIFIVIFGFIGYFISKLFSVLIVSLIGLIVVAFLKKKVEFGNLFKISIYTLTLPIMIKTILGLFYISVPFFWLIYYGLAVFYLWKVMKTIDIESEVS